METKETTVKGAEGGGPDFPGVTLHKAIQRCREFVDDGGGPLPYGRAILAMGFENVSGAGKKTLSALVQYGLVQQDPEGYRATPLARTLVAKPEDPGSRRQAVMSAEVNRKLEANFGMRRIDEVEAESFLLRLGYERKDAKTIVANYRRLLIEEGAEPGGRAATGIEPKSPISSLRPPERRTLYSVMLRPSGSIEIVQEGEVDPATIMRAVASWLELWRNDKD